MKESFVDNEFIQNAIGKYSDMVIRIAYQNTQNQADAEDVAQEVFIKLIRQPAFNDDGHMKAWLIRVTINQCRDLKKSFWHRNTVSLSEEWQPFSEEQREVFIDLWKLPKNYRNVIYLYYYEEYTVPEIAQILNKKENTVGSWLQRARKQLKHLLSEGENSL